MTRAKTEAKTEKAVNRQQTVLIFSEKILLEKYFYEVFGLKLNLSEMKFPKHKRFHALMVVPSYFNEGEIIYRFFKKWRVNVSVCLDSIDKNIDLDKEQKRPEGMYVFAHRGGNISDVVHQNKLHNRERENFLFMNLKEFLLFTGFFKFKEGYFINQLGRAGGGTVTSSRWPDDSLVQVSWSDGLVIGMKRVSSGSSFGFREIAL